MRHVQPLHPGLPRTHPAQPPRPVRAEDDRVALAAPGESHAAAAADRERRDEDRLRCAGRAAAALIGTPHHVCRHAHYRGTASDLWIRYKDGTQKLLLW